MKKILIPISHGHIARNILRTEVLPNLVKEAQVLLVIPPFKKNLYEKEFGQPGVKIIPSPEIVHSRLSKFFRSFYYYFVDTRTVKIIQGEQFLLSGKHTRYLWARFWTKIFGNIKLLRQIVKWLDQRLVNDKSFGSIFDTYAPDLVFVPAVLSDEEALMLREAKARNIPSVGMLRSWDNITVNKGNIRVFPDKLIVHTELLKDDVVKYCDYPPERTEVVGMSHFDYYITDKRISREEFFKKIGGDQKKTIYFMPIGLSDIEEDKYMLGLLENWVKSDKDFQGTQLMLSTHPNATKPIDYASSETLFIKFPDAIDFPGGKSTDREITKMHMELMASGIYHADVVVNYQGTTSIDASAFGKPVINIAFDGAKERPYLRSVRRFYDFEHYQPIIRSGGVKIVKNAVELKDAIINYLRDPRQDADGRRRIVDEQVPMHDGRAGERTAKAILSLLK